MRIRTVNPATEEEIGEYECDSQNSISQKIEVSRAVFRKWSDVEMKYRVDLLKDLGKTMEKTRKYYSELITKEMGKPIKESEAEIDKCRLLCDYYRKNAAEFLRPVEINTGSHKSYVKFEPLGVVACIMPWNFPFWQVLRFAVPAITAGNTVILKHSSICPASALALEEAFESSGFPPGVFQTVIGPGAIGEYLVRSKVNAVSVTGSVETGRRVGALAVYDVKKVVLELGGNDPFIVLEDADIKKAANGAVKERIVNNGQSCIAAKRFVVVKDVAEEFTLKLVELIGALKVGDPMARDTDVGPLVRMDALKKLESQINRSVDAGARIVFGGKRPPGKGYFYIPTVMSRVKNDMPVAQEETFGPVAPVIVVKNNREAIEVANDSELGLGASIWTRDRKSGEKFASQLEVGIVNVNGVVHSDPRMPFGGVKKSGIGRELSIYGIREFVNVKSISVY